MAQVLKYYKYKNCTIRKVYKDGRWCYDTSFSLILWDTLKEAKESVTRYRECNPIQQESNAVQGRARQAT